MKKSGDLGREATLRKTMLDECKGEKFEELLALFSTVVLRRALSSSSSRMDATTDGMGLAVGGKLTASEQECLLPLVLAHRGSVAAMVAERRRLCETYGAYDGLFRATLEEVARRAEGVARPSRQDVNAYELARRDVHDSWRGSGEWADTMVEGGGGSGGNVPSNAFLEVEFPRAWAVVRNGGALAEITAAGSTDLLADLDGRVAAQTARLQRWKEFRRTLADGKKNENVGRPGKAAAPLVFRRHQGLSLAKSKSTENDQVANMTIQVDEYRKLVADMEKELSNVHGCLPMSGTQRKRATPNYEVEVEVEVEDNTHTPSVPSSFSSARPSPRIVLPDDFSEDMSDQDADADATGLPSPAHNIRRGDMNPQTLDTATLTDRTRHSMSTSTSTSTSTSHLSTKPRQSNTPKNKNQNQNQRAGAVTPQDELLFGQDVDYASVFRSRPKIATSPVVTPPPAFHAGVDDGDEDDEEDGLALALPSSPLVGRRRRRF